MSKACSLSGDSLGVNLSLIITPMLDMAFQLMAFFIMTFQPLSEEKNISGRLLPAMKEEQKLPQQLKHEKKDDPKKEENPEPKDVVRVIVESKTPNETDPKKISGDPGRILLKFPEDATPNMVADIGEPFETSLTRMTKRLTEWSGRDGSKLQIEVHPDLRYQYFIQLQDVCRAAKFKEMGFSKLTRPRKNH